MAQAARREARFNAANRLAMSRASSQLLSVGPLAIRSPYQELLDVVTFRRGDHICLRKTGQEFEVDYVRVSGRELNIVTAGQFSESFSEREVVKMPSLANQSFTATGPGLTV